MKDRHGAEQVWCPRSKVEIGLRRGERQLLSAADRLPQDGNWPLDFTQPTPLVTSTRASLMEW